MFIASLAAFVFSNQFHVVKLAFNFWNPVSISQYRLTRLSDEEYTSAIEQALEDGDISDAQMMVEIAEENNIGLPAELIQRTHESTVEFGLRNTWDFLNGSITGEVTSTASLGGVLAADYVGIGDARDVIVQGSRLVKGDTYDQLTLGLALAGLATVVPGSGPADLGFSVLKTASKAGKMPKKLVGHLKSTAGALIDTDGLKRGLSRVSLPELKMPSINAVRTSFRDIDWRGVTKGDFAQLKKPISTMFPVDTGAIKDAFSSALRKDALEEISILANSATGIISAGGVKSGLRALEYADDAKDLSRFHSLAAHMGERTSAIIKILGKSAIKLGELLYLVIVMLVAALGWLLGAVWLSISTFRTMYSAIKLGKRYS